MSTGTMINRMFYIHVKPTYTKSGTKVVMTTESAVVQAGTNPNNNEPVYAPLTSGYTGDTTHSTFGDNNRNRTYTSDVWCLYGQYTSFELLRDALATVLETTPRSAVSVSERINIDLAILPNV